MSSYYDDRPEQLPPKPMDVVISLAQLIKLGLGVYLGWHGIHTQDWTMAGVGVLLLTTGSSHD